MHALDITCQDTLSRQGIMQTCTFANYNCRSCAKALYFCKARMNKLISECCEYTVDCGLNLRHRDKLDITSVAVTTGTHVMECIPVTEMPLCCKLLRNGLCSLTSGEPGCATTGRSCSSCMHPTKAGTAMQAAVALYGTYAGYQLAQCHSYQ